MSQEKVIRLKTDKLWIAAVVAMVAASLLIIYLFVLTSGLYGRL